MVKNPQETRDEKRAEFFRVLGEMIEADHGQVFNEWGVLYNERRRRDSVREMHERRNAAQRFGIPIDADEWTLEHKRRYVDSLGEWEWEWVPGWPVAEDVRDSLAEEAHSQLKTRSIKMERDEDRATAMRPLLTHLPTTNHTLKTNFRHHHHQPPPPQSSNKEV